MGSINGATSNRFARLNKMVKKKCDRYQQEGIYPSSGEKPANYGQPSHLASACVKKSIRTRDMGYDE